MWRGVKVGRQWTDSLNRLSFDYRTSANVDAGGDKIDVQLSADGGSTWTTVDTLDVGPSASGSKSYDITAFSNANTAVRFKPTANSFNQGGEDFYRDNVKLTAHPTSLPPTYPQNDAPLNLP